MFPEKYQHDKEIIRLTVEQIEKDFGTLLPSLIITEYSFSLFNELKSQIAAALKIISQKNKNDLRALLYRVDINEKEANEIFSSSSSRYDILAEKIIQREFKKVLTKKFFAK
jgi:hypothetical protein